MAQIEAGLNDVDAWGGEVVQLPPGPYQLQIKAADVEEKSDKDGKPATQLVITYEVISGEFSGKAVKAWFGLDFSKEVPRKRLKALVLATGVPVSSTGGFDTASLVGTKLVADAVVNTYDSKPDPITGVVTQKESVKIVNERPFAPIAANGSGVTGVAAANQANRSSIGGMSLPGLTPAK